MIAQLVLPHPYLRTNLSHACNATNLVVTTTHLATDDLSNLQLASHKVGLNRYVGNRNSDVPVGVGAPPLDTTTP